MKIDKRNPTHWLYLVLFSLNVAIATLLRWTGWRRSRGAVLVYGHKLNGNLAAIIDRAQQSGFPAAPLVFITMDPAYHRQLKNEGRASTLALSPRCIPLLASARALITDHGLHAFALMARFSRLPRIDVQHGIPFKGFSVEECRALHAYDEIWVASPLVKSLNTDRLGFDPERVHVTGYARTDRLVDRRESVEALRAQFGLEATRGKKLVLFAPTWKQDAAGRSIFPFGTDAGEFFAGLEAVCRRTDAVLLFRAHLNSLDARHVPAGDRVIAVPFADFPDAEGLLQLSDVLICDWSSIAFDYLLLDRPTIFLDVPSPFAQGFSLGPEYRFGAVVPDMATLLDRLEQCLDDPAAYHREFSARHADIRARVYGESADGHAAERCLVRLQALLASSGSSR